MALETISRRLYNANQRLEDSRAALEDQVRERTRELRQTITKLEAEVSARMLAEEMLRQARDEALEVSDLKEQFLARMSHEIRTPLNAIMGFAALLKQSELTSTQQEQLETIHASSGLLLRIINDILDLSKIQGGHVDLEFGPANLGTLVRQTVQLVSLEAQSKSIALNLPDLTGLGSVYAMDAARVQQVLLNLLSNAVKFTDEGAVSVVVQQRTVAKSDVPEHILDSTSHNDLEWVRLEFSVQDTGIGISPSMQQAIFDPFIQTNPNSHRLGSGLGLAICERLTQLLGGRIKLNSQEGQGSAFSFYILAQVVDENPGRQDVSLVAEDDIDLPENVAEQGLTHPLKILLADDYEVNRLVQEAQLNALGYPVDLVCNGEEVLRAFANNAYDVVLMDIRMPVMDGVEATRRLRENSSLRQPYIVAVSASVLPEDRARFTDAGVDAVITKPVVPEELAEILRRAHHQLDKESPADMKPGLEPVALDHSGLAMLGDGADDLLRKVLPVYLRELAPRQAGLARHHADGDAAEFGQICHGLKSSSRSIGALELAELCDVAEQAAREGRLISEETLDHLIVLAQRTALAVKQHLGGLG
ncbi:MAG: ATP-binding protein [Pseudomonadota bacterium]